jgi:DNA adenine methylase
MPTNAAVALSIRKVNRSTLARAAAPVDRVEVQAPASPFLKWVGGKAKLERAFAPLYPPGVALMRHVEPFMGGGALFFARAPARALLCDINVDLVDTYQAVRDEVELVLQQLQELAKQHGEQGYYEARERYNARDHASRAERAALFIYLNKTCFNGLYRVNKRGHFNVPMGRYAKPAIADASTLRAASARLAGVDVRCSPFQALVELAKPGDFIYLDPPYEPVSSTANFTAYARDGFSQDDQRTLRDVFRELDRRGSKLMLSNSDAPLIRELYSAYKIDEVFAARAVSCDPGKRGPVRELVVRNYGR